MPASETPGPPTFQQAEPKKTGCAANRIPARAVPNLLGPSPVFVGSFLVKPQPEGSAKMSWRQCSPQVFDTGKNAEAYAIAMAKASISDGTSTGGFLRRLGGRLP